MSNADDPVNEALDGPGTANPGQDAGSLANRVPPRQAPCEASAFRVPAGFPSPSIMIGHDATRAVDSHHLRAARALLGWAMSDLARVSGLSLSTIRRLEQSAHSVSIRNHRFAVDALRAGGIRFLTLDDGTIALGELGHMANRARTIAGDE